VTGSSSTVAVRGSAGRSPIRSALPGEVCETELAEAAAVASYADYVGAVVGDIAGLPGEGHCTATLEIAELLLGRIEPSGRLPSACPAMPDSCRSTAARSGGCTAAFGEDLNYTTVHYRNRQSRIPSSRHRYAPTARAR
jgi:hypothetical protein